MRWGSLVFMTITVVALPPAYAEVDKGLVQCAAAENPISRLACFDRLASDRGASANTSPSTPPGAGKWQTNTKTDPLTDKAVYTAAVFADTAEGKFGKPIGLFVRCKDNRTEMYVTWNSYLGRDEAMVTYRIDKEPAKASRWGLSTDNTATFFPGSPVPTLKKLANSSSFVANLTPYNDNPITAVFDMTGADKALADIRKGCNW